MDVNVEHPRLFGGIFDIEIAIPIRVPIHRDGFDLHQCGIISVCADSKRPPVLTGLQNGRPAHVHGIFPIISARIGRGWKCEKAPRIPRAIKQRDTVVESIGIAAASNADDIHIVPACIIENHVLFPPHRRDHLAEWGTIIIAPYCLSCFGVHPKYPPQRTP